MRLPLLTLGLFTLALLSRLGHAQPEPTPGPDLSVGSGVGSPGAVVPIPLTLTRNGAPVAAVSSDIAFDADVLSIDPAVDCILGASVSGFGLSAGAHMDYVRLGVFSIPTTLIGSDGPVVTCAFHVWPDASPGVSVLGNTPEIVDADGNDIPGFTGSPGSVTVMSAFAPSVAMQPPTLTLRQRRVLHRKQVAQCKAACGRLPLP